MLFWREAMHVATGWHICYVDIPPYPHGRSSEHDRDRTANLTTMMRNILNEVTLELEEKQITAHNMPPERLTVQGNFPVIFHLLRNLTDNAIAYAGSHISINHPLFPREDERFYYLCFSDTGVEQILFTCRLFERFTGGQRTFTQLAAQARTAIVKTPSFCMEEPFCQRTPPWRSGIHIYTE